MRESSEIDATANRNLTGSGSLLQGPYLTLTLGLVNQWFIVISHLSAGSFVRANGAAKPNANPNAKLRHGVQLRTSEPADT